MPFTLTMPKLSPTMEAGTIAKWHKKVGDHVESGDLLLEILTDKATVEHNAVDGGWLRKILVEEGEEAAINKPIAVFTEEKTENIDGYTPAGVGETSKPEKIAEETVPPSQSKSTTEEKPVQAASTMRQPAFIPEPPLKN